MCISAKGTFAWCYQHHQLYAMYKLQKLNLLPVTKSVYSGFSKEFQVISNYEEGTALKITIQENEIGYFMKKGIFIKILPPGQHKIHPSFGQSVHIVPAVGTADFHTIPLDILLKDEFFKNNTVTSKSSANMLAMHYKDGVFTDVSYGKRITYWTIFEKHHFEYIDMSQIYFKGEFSSGLFQKIPIDYYTVCTVAPGEVALLYFDGEFQKELPSGVYYFWKLSTKVDWRIYDMKNQSLEVSGQEILTADKVSLRLSFLLNYKILRPLRIAQEIGNLNNQLYQFIQLMLREYIGKYTLDEILNQKDEISNFIFQKLKENEEKFYVVFLTSGIRDIILPGNIRDIMNTVLIAEKTAQANVIARREEVASTRSLLNTAKLMDENKTLYKLKELEYMERICDKVGSITLSASNSNVLAQLGELLCPKLHTETIPPAKNPPKPKQ